VRCPGARAPSVVQHEHPVEGPRQVGAPQCPDDRAPFRPVEHAVQHAQFGRRIETRGGLVEHEHVRVLHQSPRDGEALPLRVRKARPAVADLVIQTDPDELGVHSDLGGYFTHQRIHAGLRVRVLEGHSSEQDVVLDGQGGAEAVGLEELDDILAILVAAAKFRPRLDNLALHRLVEHAQAMLRGDQPERQRQKAGPLLVRRRGERTIGDLGEQNPEFGQVVGADEAVLVEEIAVRRHVREQLDHEPRHLHASGGEVLQEPDLAQQCDELGVTRQVGRLERGASRRSEQQVLGHADIGMVARGIEELDERRQVFPLHAIADSRPRLEAHRGDGGMRHRVRCAREAEADDLLLHLHAPQHRERRFCQRR